MEAYVGSKYQYESYTTPPNELATFVFNVEVDMALFRVKKRIRRALYGNRYRINRVCVPQFDIYNEEKEEAFMSGFGTIDIKGEEDAYVLRKTKYVIESVNECRRKYNFYETSICAEADKHMSCYVRISESLFKDFYSHYLMKG